MTAARPHTHGHPYQPKLRLFARIIASAARARSVVGSVRIGPTQRARAGAGG